jgi:hypothetical protein
MVVQKVSGDGILGDNTTVVSVDSATQLTLSSNPTTPGEVVINIFGAQYTDGVTVDGTNVTIKVSDTTPTLYYFCSTENIDHQNEGGDDNDEAQITVSTNNPKTFGSGFSLSVTDVIVEEVVKGTVQDGFFEVQKLTTPLAEATEAVIANATISTLLTSTAITCGNFSGPAAGNIDIAVDDPLTGIVNVTAATLNVGSKVQFAATTGDLTVTNILKGSEVRIGDYLKIENVDN